MLVVHQYLQRNLTYCLFLRSKEFQILSVHYKNQVMQQMVYPISLDHFLSLRCSLFRIHLIYEHLYFLRLLAADILPGEQAGHEG